MKVYYLSITSFSDVDLGILQHFNADAEIVYGVVIQKRNANFTQNELQDYCDQHGILFEPYAMKYNLKDLRCAFTFMDIIVSIRKHKPDIIYIVAFDNIYLSLCSAFLKQSKTIVALHDVEFHSNTSFMLALKLSRAITMQLFRYFQVFSKEQLHTFKRLYPKKKVELIPLPLKDFGNGNMQQDKQPDVIRFLFFGNILPYKGLDLLLTALNDVADLDNMPHFELLVAGRAANWEAEYEYLIKGNYKVHKHIRFIGNDEIADFFVNSDYLVLPYRDATQSGPLKIALHYNVPVVASDYGSFKEEITNGHNGYLFKSGDVADLKNTLMHVLTRHATHYKQLKAAQLEYVRATYSPEQVRTAFLDMFRSVR